MNGTSNSTMTRMRGMAGPPSATMVADYSQSADLSNSQANDDMLEVDDGSKSEMFEKPRWDHSRLWHVFMDFDKTITVEDTIEPLVVQSILYNHEEVIDGGGEFLELRDVALTQQYKKWEECKRRYLHDLQTWENGVRLNLEFMRDLILGKHVNDRNGRILGADLGYNPKLNTPFASKHGSGLPVVARTWQLGYEHTIMDEIEHLESERGVEMESLNRVNKTGIFDHVGRNHALRDRAMSSRRRLTPDEIAQDAEYPQYGIKIRPGFKEFIKDLESRPNAVWGVVSVNWSKDWIQGIISRGLGSNTPLDFPIMSNNPIPPDETKLYGGGTRKDQGIAGVLPPLEPVLPKPPPPGYFTPPDVGVSVPARRHNERRKHKDIGYDHKLGPSYQLTPPTHHLPVPSLILTANDKLKALERLLEAYTYNPDRKRVKGLSMYIGDSPTDLACLLRADIGILMCPQLPEKKLRSRRSRKGKEAASPTNGHGAPSSSPYSTSADNTLGELEPEDNKVISMLQECGFAVRHVQDHAMLFRRVPALPRDGNEDGPFVRLLWCTDFEEILESGLLSNANWTPVTTIKQMNPALTMRNIVCKDSLEGPREMGK